MQVKRRLEHGFCDAIGVALQEMIWLGRDSRLSLGAWTALLISPWILLCKPPVSERPDSCATLLNEKFDRFWPGDIPSIYPEHLGLASLTVSPQNVPKLFGCSQEKGPER